jgi:methyltransferase (TIGR00027 family)
MLTLMQTGQPSRTALGAATHRAAHQVLEGGRIFADPLAIRILGPGAVARIALMATQPRQRGMRLFIAARTRFAEDGLAAAVARRVRQLVVLGAGLDTFAYRNPHAGLKVFEVDHPATQAWKRARLAQAGLKPPATLTFTPVDFERSTLAEGLSASGFAADQPSFFTWAGVVPYLSREAVLATLGFIAGLAGGSEVTFDYSDPPSSLPPDQRAAQARRASRVSKIGEPWITYFAPGELAGELRGLGFTEIEDLNPAQIAMRYFGAAGSGRTKGGHLIRARQE